MTTDPVERAMVLARTYDAVTSGERASVAPRNLGSEPWARSSDPHVGPDRGAATRCPEQTEIADIRGAHPLAPAMTVLRETLLGIADEARHRMIVTDAHGHVLWRDSSHDVLRRGDRAGTAPAAGSPVTIHSAEHLVRGRHCWTRAAAPIHDPEDGRLIGVVDVTGPNASLHPATLALVVAAARLAENQLATLAAVRDERMRARNLGHLTRLRDEPGALLTPQGRVLAAHPAGWLPDRVDLPDLPGGSLSLGEQGEVVLEPLAEGWLLRLRRPGRRVLPALGLPSWAPTAPARRPATAASGSPGATPSC
ncbi:GAF domain-containing protein [Pseudonocardia sp.]|uniref:GAF domain-containing protein n=1 Tax=Pseudonocardia sp. TaxID=60912 RepID=UPI003D0F0760